jgi:hypothetical protein
MIFCHDLHADNKQKVWAGMKRGPGDSSGIKTLINAVREGVRWSFAELEVSRRLETSAPAS